MECRRKDTLECLWNKVCSERTFDGILSKVFTVQQNQVSRQKPQIIEARLSMPLYVIPSIDTVIWFLLSDNDNAQSTTMPVKVNAIHLMIKKINCTMMLYKSSWIEMSNLNG